MAKICCAADLHGHLPPIPPCDILILAGDICPPEINDVLPQLRWLLSEFRHWLIQQPVSKTIIVAGNHDWVFQSDLLPNDIPWIYLQDGLYIHDDIKIWGTPWTPPFRRWAFMMPEEGLSRRFGMIPDVDIIISHGPPYGYGDVVDRDEIILKNGERITGTIIHNHKMVAIESGGIERRIEAELTFSVAYKTHKENVGSPSLMKAIKRIAPKLVCFGHIHTPGQWVDGDTILANVSIRDEQFRVVDQPIYSYTI